MAETQFFTNLNSDAAEAQEPALPLGWAASLSDWPVKVKSGASLWEGIWQYLPKSPLALDFLIGKIFRAALFVIAKEGRDLKMMLRCVKKRTQTHARCSHWRSKVYNRFSKKQVENSALCLSSCALNERLMGIHGCVCTSIDHLEGCRKTKVVASQERSPGDKGLEWKTQCLHIQSYPIPFCIFNFFPW